jgi:large subunit ribosomal protein L6
MSRIGKQPITLPSGVTATFVDGVLSVKGPKGELSRPIKRSVETKVSESEIVFTPVQGSDEARALWGTYASHALNMIEGVTRGFKKQLEIEGVGYRAEVKGSTIVLSVGFSHPVSLAIPGEITVTVEKGLITISGIDKEVVGQFAANVRKVKEPEPYKGKGIHYVGEFIIRKQGKKGVA